LHIYSPECIYIEDTIEILLGQAMLRSMFASELLFVLEIEFRVLVKHNYSLALLCYTDCKALKIGIELSNIAEQVVVLTVQAPALGIDVVCIERCEVVSVFTDLVRANFCDGGGEASNLPRIKIAHRTNFSLADRFPALEQVTEGFVPTIGRTGEKKRDCVPVNVNVGPWRASQ
jgi:hypothetical protein